MTGAEGLTLSGVTVGYRDGRRARVVLEGVEAFARPGELTALIGPNGTGKSTLLRTVAGLQPELGGSIRLDGTLLSGLDAVERARIQAVVLTERVAPGRLSARELVALGRHPHTGVLGGLTAADERLVDEALEAVGGAHLAARDLSELSDGERQRVMTARALAQRPRLLLMDEPSAFLDAPGRVALTGLVRRLAAERGVVAVVSTHEVDLALQVADRIWLVDRAGSLWTGIPEELMFGGLLGEVFDSDDLAFDPASGGFRLVTAPRGTVRVHGPAAPDLDHLLIRRGWRRVEVDTADLDLWTRPGGGWDVHAGARTDVVDDLAQLARALGAVEGRREDA